MTTFDTLNPPSAANASFRRRFVRGGALLSAGHVSARLLSLVRLAILARLLGPAEFGLASLLILTLTMLEMMSNLSFDKAIIRAGQRRSLELQSAAHLLCVIRGVIVAVVLLLAAGPVAAWLGVPESAPLIRWLALAPFVAGFVHLEPKRVQRELRYAPDVSVELGAHLLVTIAAWPVAVWLGDATAAVLLLVGRSLAQAIVSHAVSRSGYRWSIDRRDATHLLTFGVPLILNGLLFFAIMQGDQLVIGKVYGLTELGLYAVVFGLLSAPTMILARVSVSLLLPVYARGLDDRAAFEHTHALAARGLALIALAVIGGAAALGTIVIPLIYGGSYAPSLALVVAIALAQGIRILRIAPTVAAIAHADTSNAMFANLSRVCALPVAMAFAMSGAPLATIAFCGAAGELVALGMTVRRLAARDHVPSSTDRAVAAGVALALVPILSVAFVAPEVLSPVLSPAASFAVLVIACVALITNWPVLRGEATALLRLVRPSRPTPRGSKGAVA